MSTCIQRISMRRSNTSHESSLCRILCSRSPPGVPRCIRGSSINRRPKSLQGDRLCRRYPSGIFPSIHNLTQLLGDDSLGYPSVCGDLSKKGLRSANVWEILNDFVRGMRSANSGFLGFLAHCCSLLPARFPSYFDKLT